MLQDPQVLSLPTVIWSGIVAALISLGGVVLSNRASISRLKEQLQHDSREKHRDRLLGVRKDVYLNLVAELNRANALLGTLASKDPTDGQFAEPLQAAISELAKVQLIGSRESAALAIELTAVYGEALIRLIGVAKPMHEAQSDIRIAGDLYEQSFSQGQRVLAAITEENESGAPNGQRMESLLRSFDFYREQYSAHSASRNAAWELYNAQHKDFAKAVFEELKRIGPLHVKLTCAIRDEVGLDSDASDLKRRLDENLARANSAVGDQFEKLSQD